MSSSGEQFSNARIKSKYIIELSTSLPQSFSRTSTNQTLGQHIAERINPGSQQQGQYSIPSLQLNSCDGFSCQALPLELVEEVSNELDEVDSDYEEPVSVLGPWR
jgi:hypothetical protein